MSHFKSYFTSPAVAIGVAYIYVSIVSLILFLTGFYEHSDFFSWGPPILFFGHKINDNKTFYSIHALIFVHQIVNSLVSSVVYPWIINEVQDPKTKTLKYSRVKSLTIINLNNIFFQIDSVFIIMGFMSQISFVINIMIANIFIATFINNRYITKKEEHLPLSDSEIILESYMNV